MVVPILVAIEPLPIPIRIVGERVFEITGRLRLEEAQREYLRCGKAGPNQAAPFDEIAPRVIVRIHNTLGLASDESQEFRFISSTRTNCVLRSNRSGHGSRLQNELLPVADLFAPIAVSVLTIP